MTSAPFVDAMRLYLRLVLILLAAAGLAGLVALQVGWLITPEHARLLVPPAEIETADTITLSGPASLRSQVILVDPSLVYDLSAEVRTFAADASAPTRIDLGVETLDANLKRLESGPRGHRYGGARNYQLRPIQGWVKVKGEITGEGDEGHHQFRPGTRYVRIVAHLNRGREGNTTEIRKVRLVPRLAMETR
jgi:hypothetical protein